MGYQPWPPPVAADATVILQPPNSTILRRLSGQGHSPEEGPRPANSALHGKKVKVGRFGNALVPTEEARVEGLPTMRQETRPARASAKSQREQANEECLGGLRSPWRSAEALHVSGAVGAKVRKALEQALVEHPALLLAADGDKEFEPSGDAQMAGVERARVLVAEALGVAHPQPLGRSTWWQPHLVHGWIAAANDPDVDLPRWLLEGAPLGGPGGHTCKKRVPPGRPGRGQ